LLSMMIGVYKPPAYKQIKNNFNNKNIDIIIIIMIKGVNHATG